MVRIISDLRKEKIMKYYKEIKTKEGFTLSIDMVTIDYSISSSAARDELAKILDNLPLLYAVLTFFSAQRAPWFSASVPRWARRRDSAIRRHGSRCTQMRYAPALHSGNVP